MDITRLKSPFSQFVLRNGVCFSYINLNIVAFLSFHTAMVFIVECYNACLNVCQMTFLSHSKWNAEGGWEREVAVCFVSLVNYIHFFWALNGWTKFRWVDPVYMNIACKRLINVKLPIILCNAFIGGSIEFMWKKHFKN